MTQHVPMSDFELILPLVSRLQERIEWQESVMRLLLMHLKLSVVDRPAERVLRPL